jgi:hypothetical protein
VSAWLVNPAVHVMFAARAERERAQRKETREDIAASVGTLRRSRANQPEDTTDERQYRADA